MTAAWTIQSRRNQVSRAHSTSLSSLPDLSDSYQMEDRSRCSSVSGLIYSNYRQPASPSSLAWTSGLSNYRAQSNTSVSFLGRRITREYRSTFVLADNQTVGVTRRETFLPEAAQADVRVNLCLQGTPEDLRDSSVTHFRAQSEPPCRLRIRDRLDDDRWARIMLTTDEPQNSELLRRFGKNYSASRDAGRNARKHLPDQITEDYRLQRDAPLSESDYSTARPTHLGSNLQLSPEETLKHSPQSATSYGIPSVLPSDLSADASLSGIGETRLDADGTYRQSGAYISRFPASIGNCSAIETVLQTGAAPDNSDYIATTLPSPGVPYVEDTTGKKGTPIAASGTPSGSRRGTPKEELQQQQEDDEEEKDKFSTVLRRPHTGQSGYEQKTPALVLVTDRPLTPAGLEVIGSSSSFEEPSTERVEKDTCPRTSRPQPTDLSGSQPQHSDKCTPEAQDSSSSLRDFDLSSLPATDRSESIIYCSHPSSAAVAAFSPNDDTVASVSSVPVDQQPRLPRRKSLESGQDLTRSGLAGSRHRRSKSADPCLEPIAHARSRHESGSSTDAPTLATPRMAQANENSSGLPFLVEKPSSDSMGLISPEGDQSPLLLAGLRNRGGSRNTSTPDNADVSAESGFIDAGAALSEPTTCSLPKGRKGEDEEDDGGVLARSNEKQPQHVQPKPRAPRQRRQNADAGIAPADGSPASAQPDSASDRNRQVTLFGPSGKRIQQSEEPHETDQTLSGSKDGLRSGQRGLKLSDLMFSGASLAPYSVTQHVELHTSPRMNSMAGQLMAKDNQFSDSLSSISEERSQNLDLSVEHPGEPQASDRKSCLSTKGPPGEGDYAARERSSNASSSAQSSLPHLSGESGTDVFGPPDMLPLFVVSEETGQHSGNDKRKPIVGNSEWSLEDIESLSQVSSEPNSQTSSVIHILPKEGPQDDTPTRTPEPQSVGSLLPPKSRRPLEEDGEGKSARGSTEELDSPERRPTRTKTPYVKDSPGKDSVQKNKRKPVLSPTHQEGSPSVSDTTASSFRGPFDPRANELEEEDAGAADHTLKRRRRGQRQDEEALDAMGRSGTPSTDQSDLGSHRHRKSRKHPGSEQAPTASSKHGSQDEARGGRGYPQKDLEGYPYDVSVTSEEDEGVSDLDNEEDLRPPALRRDIEAKIIGLPDEYTKLGPRPKLRPLRHPLYDNLTEQQRIDDKVQKPRRRDVYADPKPLRTRDQNVPESSLGSATSDKHLPDVLLVRTRRRTMSGITGRLPPGPSTSTNTLWFGDHPVPTKTQIDAADNAPMRLSNIQLQAQAELARRRTRSTHRGHSLDRVTASRILTGGGGIGTTSTLGPSTSTLYGVRGKRMKGGAPLVERSISRRLSKRDGYETLSVVSIPHLPKEKSPRTRTESATASRRRKERSAKDVRDGV